MVDFFLTLPGLSSRSDFIKKLSGFLAPRILRRLEVRWKRFVVYSLVPSSSHHAILYDFWSVKALLNVGKRAGARRTQGIIVLVTFCLVAQFSL